ncbi:hypothetical protein TNCV_1993401 [Trichonephila clavipes]|nr:hypothetical protein TNCV_1993401 [Trichonephila clavipes]
MDSHARNIPLDKSDHLCLEAVTGLCRYPLQYSPASESVDRRTNDLLRQVSLTTFLHQVSPTTLFAASSEPDDFLIALLKDRWHHDRLKGCIYLNSVKATNEVAHIRRTESVTYGFVGQVVRMDEDRTTKKVFNAQPIGTRRKARSNLRWIDGLKKDILVLRTKNWRTLERRRLYARLRFYVKAVTPKCLGNPPVDRDRLNAHIPALIPREGIIAINSKSQGRKGVMGQAHIIDFVSIEYSIPDVPKGPVM